MDHQSGVKAHSRYTLTLGLSSDLPLSWPKGIGRYIFKESPTAMHHGYLTQRFLYLHASRTQPGQYVIKHECTRGSLTHAFDLPPLSGGQPLLDWSGPISHST